MEETDKDSPEKATKEGNEDDDVPQDFFDDFSNPDFMEGLNIVDAWDDEQTQDDAPEPNTNTNKSHSDKSKPDKTASTSSKKQQKTSSKGKDKARSKNRRNLKNSTKLTTQSKQDREQRRDPQKTKRDLENYKVKCAKDKEKKILDEKLKVVETGLVPPGMEMDVDVNEVMKKANCSELHDTWEGQPNGKPSQTVYPDRKPDIGFLKKGKLPRGLYIPDKVRERQEKRRSRSGEFNKRRRSKSPRNVIESHDEPLRKPRENRWFSPSPLRGRERRLSSPDWDRSYKRTFERNHSRDRPWLSDLSRSRDPVRLGQRERSRESDREAWLRDSKRISRRNHSRSRSRSRSRNYSRGRSRSRSRDDKRSRRRSKDKVTFLEEIKQLLNNPVQQTGNLHPYVPPPLPVPPPNHNNNNNSRFEYDQQFFIGDDAFNFAKAPEPLINMQQPPVHLGGQPQPLHMVPLHHQNVHLPPHMGGPPPMPSQFPHPSPLHVNVSMPPQLFHSQNKPAFSPGTFDLEPNKSAISMPISPAPSSSNTVQNKLPITLSADKAVAKKEIAKLFEEKKITLSDYLTLSSTIEDSVAPTVNLTKKIKVISRCQDIIKILGEDKLTNGRLKVKHLPKKTQQEEQFRSPLRRKQAVRFAYTTPANKSSQDWFSCCLNQLLADHGVVETINLEDDDENNVLPPSPPLISKKYNRKSLEPSKFLMKMVQTEPYKCELCDVRGKKVFVTTGTQCDFSTKSVGVQAPEPCLAEDIFKHKSLASMTPAQLLMKEKEGAHGSQQKFGFASEWRGRFSPPRDAFEPQKNVNKSGAFENSRGRGKFGSYRPQNNFFRR